MNLTGQKVKHKTLGVGTVTGLDDEGRLIIEFASKTSKFQYPQAFETFICAEDEKIQAEICKELEEAKATAAAEKAARIAEAARQRMQEAEKSRDASLEKAYKPVKRTEGQPLTFFAFMGMTFDYSVENGLLWAPLYTSRGDSIFYWDNMMNLREGDIILHGSAGLIKAISRVKNTWVDFRNPYDVEGVSEDYPDGRKVDCEYTVLKNPIKTSDYKEDIIRYCQTKYAPFDKNGNGNRGFLYDIDTKLVSVFLKGIIQENKEIGELEYIQWLLNE